MLPRIIFIWLLLFSSSTLPPPAILHTFTSSKVPICLARDRIDLQSWPKCVGQSAFFPNCCNILGYGARFGQGDLIEVTNSRVFVTFQLRLTPWGDCFAVLECCNIVTHDIMFNVSSAEHCMTVFTYKSVFSCRKKISCFSVLHTIVRQLRFVYAKTYSMYQLAIFMVFEQCSVIRKRSYK